VPGIRAILITIAMLAVPSIAIAQSGTPEEQAACRPDVRRFCYRVHPVKGSGGYLQCLQEHRARLSARCRAVLESHGV